MMHTLKQYGSYVNTTDVMLAASTDPLVQVITERQAQQAGETLDYLAYKVFRAGTSVRHSDGAANRGATLKNINGATCVKGAPAAGTNTNFDAAIRSLEQNDAKKMRKKLRASVGIATEPIRESYIGICHPDMRQDLEANTSFVPVEKYSNTGDAMDGEIGSVAGIRIITTTQAVPWKNAGGTATGSSSARNQVTSDDTSADIYPMIILAQDFGGCATLGGMDSLRSKIHAPAVGPGDPLGQRGSIAWDTFYSCIILQDLWMYRIECAVTNTA